MNFSMTCQIQPFLHKAMSDDTNSFSMTVPNIFYYPKSIINRTVCKSGGIDRWMFVTLSCQNA